MSANTDKTAKPGDSSLPPPSPTLNPRAALPPLTPRPLDLKNLRQAQYTTNRWCVVMPANVAYERVFEPEFWANVARPIRPGDLIEVHSERGDYFAELYVINSKRMSVEVVELRNIALASAKNRKNVGADLSVEWRGAIRKYCIVRGSGKTAVIVAEGYVSEEDAAAALGARAKEDLA
jgi:hypothetical protein